MIRILFFAQTRELIDTSELTLDMSSITVDSLIEQLSLKGEKWSYALKEKKILCAVNKQLVDGSYVINTGDEVAFFPPVTGG